MSRWSSVFDSLRQSSNRLSLYVLFTILGGLLTVGAINLARVLGPQTMPAPAVPFGLPPGTPLLLGKHPENPVSALGSLATQEMERARELWRYGKWRESQEIFAALLLRYPNQPSLIAGQAIALLQSDSLDDERTAQLDALIAGLERIPEAGAELLAIRGIRAFRQGKWKVAADLLEQSLKIAPQNRDTRYYLGLTQLGAGEPQGAATTARTGISISQGSDSRFYALLARAWHDAGLLDSCSQVVEYALSRFPGESSLALLQGYLHEYQGAFDKAERLYRRVLALEPDNRDAQNALASLGEKAPPGSARGSSRVTPRDRAQTAIDILQPLVQTYPENLPLREALGQAYLKARDFDNARRQFEIIQERDPEYPDIRLRIQEASAVNRDFAKEIELGEALKRGIDSLRSRTSDPNHRAFSERLGHYLVRWGASPKEFFAQYPITRFTRLDSLIWQERFWEGAVEHRYTVVFKPGRGLSRVHVTLRDTSALARRSNVVYDLFGRFLGQNSRISGQGVYTGDTECDATRFQGAVWESRDNFELMIERTGVRGEVRLLRLDRSQFETMPRLCEYLEWIQQY